MSTSVSVVIPSLNEEPWIETSVRSALDAGAVEVIVADGGSVDRTTSVAASLGARAIQTEGLRARQMNDGFAASTGDVICFLHADTTLPPGACKAMSETVDRGFEFGGFRIRFVEGGSRLAFVAFMINARTTLLRTPWGDQAQFFRRDAFERAGRFREVPIMEDYEMARRMKRRARPAVLPLHVSTSGRRFLELGVLRTAAINWRIIVAWHMGASPESLRRLYGSR